jgi:hypothetical protein
VTRRKTWQGAPSIIFFTLVASSLTETVQEVLLDIPVVCIAQHQIVCKCLPTVVAGQLQALHTDPAASVIQAPKQNIAMLILVNNSY